MANLNTPYVGPITNPCCWYSFWNLLSKNYLAPDSDIQQKVVAARVKFMRLSSQNNWQEAQYTYYNEYKHEVQLLQHTSSWEHYTGILYSDLAHLIKDLTNDSNDQVKIDLVRQLFQNTFVSWDLSISYEQQHLKHIWKEIVQRVPFLTDVIKDIQIQRRKQEPGYQLGGVVLGGIAKVAGHAVVEITKGVAKGLISGKKANAANARAPVLDYSEA